VARAVWAQLVAARAALAQGERVALVRVELATVARGDSVLVPVLVPVPPRARPLLGIRLRIHHRRKRPSKDSAPGKPARRQSFVAGF